MPSAKKQRSKKKKAAAPAAPKRSPAVAAAASRIEAANATPDLSAGLEAFLSIDLPAATVAVSGPAARTPAPSEPVRLEIRSPKTLLDGDAQVMYDLLKGNMHDMYMEAGWGWNKAEKWREMEHRDSRFLIARCGAEDDSGPEAAAAGVAGLRIEEEGGAESNAVNGAGSENAIAEAAKARAGGEEKTKPGGAGERIAGYCDFRFAWDQDENEDGEGVGGMEDVLYVYELQVAPWATRRGLGRRMMQAIEVRLAYQHGRYTMGLSVPPTVLENLCCGRGVEGLPCPGGEGAISETVIFLCLL